MEQLELIKMEKLELIKAEIESNNKRMKELVEAVLTIQCELSRAVEMSNILDKAYFEAADGGQNAK